jgi:RNA polymerase sigma factor (sigma-70 family)
MSETSSRGPDKEQEFARVVVAHRNALLRYGLRRLDDRSEAEDLVAETFVVVWRRFDEIPARDEELFWLYGVAAWALSNIRRTHRRSMRLESRMTLERELERKTPRYSAEDIEELMKALGSLSFDERELIQLAYWEKLSYREIGVVLGCSEKAAGIRLSRARRTLRNRLIQTTASVIPMSLLREER